MQSSPPGRLLRTPRQLHLVDELTKKDSCLQNPGQTLVLDQGFEYEKSPFLQKEFTQGESKSMQLHICHTVTTNFQMQRLIWGGAAFAPLWILSDPPLGI